MAGYDVCRSNINQVIKYDDNGIFSRSGNNHDAENLCPLVD